MGRIGIFFLFYLIGFGIRTNAQDSLKLSLVRHIDCSATGFSVDNLANIYLIGRDAAEVKKLDKNGDSSAIFDNVKMYGNISLTDASNPLKILIYYKDFATVVVLDRFLHKLYDVDLRRSGIMQAKVVATSYDNQIWVYDEQSAQIKKVDAQGNVLLVSNDLRTLFDMAPNPSKMIDDDGNLYLYDKKMGWLIFDYYGGFKQRFPYLDWQNVSVVNGLLFGLKAGKIQVYHPKKFGVDTLHTSIDDILSSGAKQILITNNRLYLLEERGLSIFNIL